MRKIRSISDKDLKELQIKAYQAIIKYDITELPVPTVYDGVGVYSLQIFARYNKMRLKRVMRRFGCRGAIYFADELDMYVVLYNEADPGPLQRWIIATGIAYIELNYHEKISRDYFISLLIAPQYIAEFTYSFTCPDIILNECKINTAEEIIDICQIPFSYAREKWKRIKSYSMFHSGLSTVLIHMFSSFIERHRLKKSLGFDVDLGNIESEIIRNLCMEFMRLKNKENKDRIEESINSQHHIDTLIK